MAYIDSYASFAKITHDLLETNKAGLNLQAVYFGDQARIPVTPAACVEPGGKRRALNGLPRRTEVNLTCYVLVYHYRLATVEEIREDLEFHAEQIETFLHGYPQLVDIAGSPRVVHCMITDIDTGYSTKRNSLFRASRLTFEATSQVQLPSSTP